MPCFEIPVGATKDPDLSQYVRALRALSRRLSCYESCVRPRKRKVGNLRTVCRLLEVALSVPDERPSAWVSFQVALRGRVGTLFTGVTGEDGI